VLDTRRRSTYALSVSANRDRKPVGPEEGRANVRALYVSQLETAGRARDEALREADGHLDRIARLIPDALKAGLSLTDVARITGVSRPTLYQLRARYGESHANLRIAVLQAVQNTDGSLAALVRELDRPEAELWPVLQDFIDGDALELEPTDEEEPKPAFLLTPKGYALIEVLFELEDEAEIEQR
jgi:hypothetical protein